MRLSYDDDDDDIQVKSLQFISENIKLNMETYLLK